MNEMIERVAREIWDKHMCEYCVTSRDTPLPADCCCYDASRAALAAAREPTDAMLDAARWACVAEDAEDVAGVWTTMIDAALEEK